MTGFYSAGTAMGNRGAMMDSSVSRSQQLGKTYQPFANPFFDQASTYTPPTVKALFSFCRHFHLTHGVINAVNTKASEYPITDIIFTHKEPTIVRRYEELFMDQLNYPVAQYEINLDYHVYGNAFVSVGFPMRKKLTCQYCKTEHDCLSIRPHWRYTMAKFWLTCPKCGQAGNASAKDEYLRKLSEITITRWNPELISIFDNEVTGRADYVLDLSQSFRSQILMGRKDLVATTPEVFLEAVHTRRQVVFDPTEVFHMRRPSLSMMQKGWGIPLLMPVLKDAYYMQIMKKAQECVHPDTLIDTSRGLVKADEVIKGDFVRTHTGLYQPVVARADRPMRDGERAYEITVTGLREFAPTFSETHPIMVLRRNDEARRIDTKDQQRSSIILRNPHLYGFQWVQAQDVAVGDYVGFPRSRNREPQRIDLAKSGAWSATTDQYVYTQAGQATAEEFEAGGLGAHGGAARKVARRLLRDDREPARIPRYLELDDDLAYIAGWFAGDGCCEDRVITFCMGPEDDGLELQAAISRAFPFTTFSSTPDRKSRGWSLRVFGSAFARFLGAWFPGKARTKRVPEDVRNSPDAVVAAFLRGYLEADGHDRGTQIAVGSASTQLAYDVWALGISLGCIGTLTQRACHDSEITNALGEVQQISADGRQHNYVIWSTRSAERLRALMADADAPEVVSGKSGFFFGDHFAARVLSTEEVPCERVIDFEVETDHSFCVPGMAVHNSVLLQHLIPQIFLFPQPATSGADPFITANLADWRDHIRRELARQRMDPAYYGILPFPLGHQVIGENGRSLLLMPEIQQMAEQICVGMGFPVNLVFGDGTYAGSSVAMRMLENFFLANVRAHRRLLRWVIARVSAFLNWPRVETKFKPFRMADDLQRQAFMFQLNQAKAVSTTSLLAHLDMKVEDEAELMTSEASILSKALREQQIIQAEIQGDAGVAVAKGQAKAQEVMAQAQAAAMAPKQDPFQSMLTSSLATGGGVPVDAAMRALAEAVRAMPEGRKQVYLAQLQDQSPDISALLQQAQGAPQQGVDVAGGAPQADPTQGVDMRPQPEVLPPRRVA